ncbi:MAG: L,D-transpeptidase family protein [Thermoanaerobacteraceae bacterium]|nr:L,D-transpeptidase family protein [Thermoanaerobacteraceae bacterium]
MKKLVSCILIIAVLFTYSGISQGSMTNKIILNIPAFSLEYYEGETLIRTYPVAVGRSTSQTPMGDFQVINKLKNPTWFPKGRQSVPPGHSNPLGTRWIGFKNGYGIHGNNNPSAIGTMASAGCVRLYNQDVEELYEKVAIGTPVKIIYQTQLLHNNGIKPYLKVYPDIYGFGVNRKEAIITKLNESNIQIAQQKLDTLLNKVNTEPVIFNQGYFMTFNKRLVTNDIEIIDQKFYINKQEIEKYCGAVCKSAWPAVIQEREYINFDEFFNNGQFDIKINKEEEIISITGILITVNGELLKAGCLKENNITLIPIRPVAESLGWTVSWNNETRTAFANDIPLKTVLINSRSYMTLEEICLTFNLYSVKDDTKGIINFFSR